MTRIIKLLSYKGAVPNNHDTQQYTQSAFLPTDTGCAFHLGTRNRLNQLTERESQHHILQQLQNLTDYFFLEAAASRLNASLFCSTNLAKGVMPAEPASLAVSDTLLVN